MGGLAMRTSTAALCAYLCVAAALRADADESALLPPAEYVAQRLPEVLPDPAPETPTLTLEAVEQMALAANPALAEAAARVRAARGQAYQAGLPPNVEFGYSASEIGN